MKSRLKSLPNSKNWLALLFIFCLVLHAYLAYPYFTYGLLNDSDGVGKGYFFGMTADLIALFILPLAIWFFIKKTTTGWLLIVAWLLLRISFDLHFCYYVFNFLQGGGTMLQSDGWLFLYMIELIILTAVLVYLLKQKSRERFKVKRSNIIFAFMIPAMFYFAIYVVTTI